MSADMAMTIRVKLHPTRFTAMSNKMAAVVAFLLDAEWAKPPIADLVIDKRGTVFAVLDEEHDLHQVFIGSAADLERNWSILLRTAELTEAEYAFAMLRYRDRIHDWRRMALS
jgi:hypothetical protein